MDKIVYKERLLHVFQEDIFNELMDFWKIVEESTYDFKIFISKKCYVLYKVFVPILHSYTQKNCIKITDSAIPLYIREMKNASVLVIDDVFIHGRAVSKVNEEIGGKTKKIFYYTFAKNNNNEIPQDTYTEEMKRGNAIVDNDASFLSYIEMLNKALLNIQQNAVKGYLNCNEYQWKRISDLIMKSLWAMNMPYASYLPVFIMKDSNRIFLSDSSDKFVQYSSHSQKEQAQNFTYYVQPSKKNITKKSLIHYCFIISKNNFIGDCKFTPMVFFDCENTSIDKEFIYGSMKNIYGREFNSLKECFIKSSNSQQGLISMFKYLIFSVSYLAAKRFFLINGIKKCEYVVDVCNAQYSFGSRVEKYLTLLEKIDGINLLNRIEDVTIKTVEDEHRKIKDFYEGHNKLLDGLKNSYFDMKSCSIEKESPSVVDVLARYFKFNNIYNEENFYKFRQSKKKYVTGLRFSEIKEFLEKKGFSIKEIIFGLMHQYNLGAATIDFLYDYDRRGKVRGINMYWRAGEQSYKCISRTYVLIVYFQNEYSRIFNKGVSNFLYNILLEVAQNNYALCGIPFSKSDFEKYCNCGDNVYNAFDIERYCEQKEFKYLGYVANQMQQYILRGNLQEVKSEDVSSFKSNLFEFMKKHTDENMLHNCEKILWHERGKIEINLQ